MFLFTFQDLHSTQEVFKSQTEVIVRSRTDSFFFLFDEKHGAKHLNKVRDLDWYVNITEIYRAFFTSVFQTIPSRIAAIFKK